MNKYTKRFAEYMGFEIVKVGYFGVDETEWQIKNEDWMNEVGIKSVGMYSVNVATNEWYYLELAEYTTSWDWLLPVWKKASTEIFGQADLMAKCMANIFDVDIDKAVKNIYKLINSK